MARAQIVAHVRTLLLRGNLLHWKDCPECAAVFALPPSLGAEIIREAGREPEAVQARREPVN
jgi:hypothetical protein